MKILKFFIKNFEEVVAGIALSLTNIIIIINVLVRYVTGFSFNWAEEIAIISFIWCVFIGGSACYKRGMHIGIDVIVRFLPGPLEKAAVLFTDVLLIIASAYITYLSLIFSISAWVKPTHVIQIPYTFVDISATIGFGLMTVHSIIHFISVYTGRRKKPEDGECAVLDI